MWAPRRLLDLVFEAGSRRAIGRGHERCPAFSAQLMPGEANSCRPVPIASAHRIDLKRIDCGGVAFTLIVCGDHPRAGLISIRPRPSSSAAAGEPEIGYFEAACGPMDAQDIVELDEDSAGDLGDDAILEFQNRSRPFVGTGLAGQHAVPATLIGSRKGLPAAAPAMNRAMENRVAANVEDRAAGKIVREEPMLRHELRHLGSRSSPGSCVLRRQRPAATSSPSFAVCGCRRYMKPSACERAVLFDGRGRSHRLRTPIKRNRLLDEGRACRLPPP